MKNTMTCFLLGTVLVTSAAQGEGLSADDPNHGVFFDPTPAVFDSAIFNDVLLAGALVPFVSTSSLAPDDEEAPLTPLAALPD